MSNNRSSAITNKEWRIIDEADGPAVYRLLTKLHKKHIFVSVALLLIQKKKVAEIAKITNLTEQGVHGRIHRIRNAIQSQDETPEKRKLDLKERLLSIANDPEIILPSVRQSNTLGQGHKA